MASGLRLRSDELNIVYGVRAHTYPVLILVTGCTAYAGYNLTRVTLWHYSCVHSRLIPYSLDLSERSVRRSWEADLFVLLPGKERLYLLRGHSKGFLDGCPFDEVLPLP